MFNILPLWALLVKIIAYTLWTITSGDLARRCVVCASVFLPLFAHHILQGHGRDFVNYRKDDLAAFFGLFPSGLRRIWRHPKVFFQELFSIGLILLVQWAMYLEIGPADLTWENVLKCLEFGRAELTWENVLRCLEFGHAELTWESVLGHLVRPVGLWFLMGFLKKYIWSGFSNSEVSFIIWTAFGSTSWLLLRYMETPVRWLYDQTTVGFISTAVPLVLSCIFLRRRGPAFTAFVHIELLALNVISLGVRAAVAYWDEEKLRYFPGYVPAYAQFMLLFQAVFFMAVCTIPVRWFLGLGTLKEKPVNPQTGPAPEPDSLLYPGLHLRGWFVRRLVIHYLIVVGAYFASNHGNIRGYTPDILESWPALVLRKHASPVLLVTGHTWWAYYLLQSPNWKNRHFKLSVVYGMAIYISEVLAYMIIDVKVPPEANLVWDAALEYFELQYVILIAVAFFAVISGYGLYPSWYLRLIDWLLDHTEPVYMWIPLLAPLYVIFYGVLVVAANWLHITLQATLATIDFTIRIPAYASETARTVYQALSKSMKSMLRSPPAAAASAPALPAMTAMTAMTTGQLDLTCRVPQPFAQGFETAPPVQPPKVTPRNNRPFFSRGDTSDLKDAPKVAPKVAAPVADTDVVTTCALRYSEVFGEDRPEPTSPVDLVWLMGDGRA
ncbi:hypothetical protein EDC01DRAFT_627641 [Geopyxis carbonaria]|nr:hypothetical protein EDC01DRAFT_627641 [Geopyxis carbonaria]